MLHLVDVIDVTGQDCLNALESPIKDFEDALIAECAVKFDVDYIITRDKDFLHYSKTISPDKFLEII